VCARVRVCLQGCVKGWDSARVTFLFFDSLQQNSS